MYKLQRSPTDSAGKGQHSESGHVTQTSTMMAVLRFRRKRVFLVLLVACLFWLMYLLSSLPPKGEYTASACYALVFVFVCLAKIW